MISHTLHQFHENDLFTSAAAMSYFGLMTLFPALLLLLALSNRIATGSQMIQHIVEVYPGSSKFLHETIRSLANVNGGIIATCAVIVLWAGSWVFAVVERALNRVWGTTHRTFLHGRLLTLAMICHDDPPRTTGGEVLSGVDIACWQLRAVCSGKLFSRS